MAHKKGVGSTTNGRDSQPKYLGVKKFDSEFVRAGNIIIRQRGTNVQPGKNVGLGRDHTIFALIDGYVHFEHATKLRRRVSVYAEPKASTQQSRDAQAKGGAAAPTPAAQA